MLRKSRVEDDSLLASCTELHSVAVKAILYRRRGADHAEYVLWGVVPDTTIEPFLAAGLVREYDPVQYLFRMVLQ